MKSERRIIPLADRHAWETALADVPHAYAHTWENCHAMWLTTSAPTFLYSWRSEVARVACAFSERSFQEQTDIYTPYGFGGFVGVGDWSGVRHDWSDFVRRAAYVCGFIIVNPILSGSAELFPKDMHIYNDLFVLDLRLSEQELFQQLSENRRRQVRRFAELPVRVVDERDRCSEFLLAHLAAFYREKGAGSAYNFSQETIRLLAGSPNALLLGAEAGGKLESVALFVYTSHVAEYFVAVSTPVGRSHTAPLLWHATLALRRLGIPFLNLGGGVRRGDGIACFKQRFGAERLPLGALKQVYRPDTYAALCGVVGADPVDHTDFFPAYHGHERPKAERGPGVC